MTSTSTVETAATIRLFWMLPTKFDRRPNSTLP